MIDKLKVFFRAYKWPLLSGFLIGTSYIPFPPWAMFFCFVPLWFFWQKNSHSYKKIIISGWITSFMLSVIGFYWVAYVIHVHGNIPWILSIPLMLVFCGIFAYYIPLAGVLWKFSTDRLKISHPVLKILMLCFITILAERFYKTLFPWNFGYPWLWVQLPGYQLAEYIGFEGLSAITIFTNAIAYLGYSNYKQQKPYKTQLIGAISLLIIINFLGFARKHALPKPTESVRVLAVQANIGNLIKEMARRGQGFRKQILDTYTRITSSIADNDKNIDFVIWPETALPYTFSQQNTFNPGSLALRIYLSKTGLRLVTGGYYENPDTRRTSNALLYFDASGNMQKKPYRKSHLLAFGEYIPGAKYFPKLADRLNIGSFQPGDGPQAFIVDKWRIGPQICYESLFPYFSRGLADKDIDFIVNVTNDSWYGPTSEPYQHLYMTLARGIEVRKPIIRETNTGFTTAMLADGTLLARSPLFKEWGDVFNIKYIKNSKKTFFQIFPWTSTLLTFLSIIIVMLINKFVILKNN